MRTTLIPGADLDETFEAIAQAAITAAERVPCSKARFAEGLKDMEMTLKDRRLMMEDEIKRDDDAE
jgi:hypothetical protein